MLIWEKPALIIGGLAALILSSLLIAFFIIKRTTNTEESVLLTPLAAEDSATEVLEASPSAKLANSFHLLLLGLDKRSPEQKHFRTDTIMVISILKDSQKILLTSIPRDLWLDGAKINTFFSQGGFAGIGERVQTVTGLTPSHYVAIDFTGTVWAVDRIGGVETDIERSFTDYSYPPDRPAAPHPPSFTAGPQLLTGEEVLEYCRSRKGTNGEANDFRRMRRQQNLLVALPQAFEKSDLAKLGTEALYNLLTGHLETNLGVGEVAELLWLLKDYQDFQVERVVLEIDNYLYHPPMASYGGAYVLRPSGDSWQIIHDALAAKVEPRHATPSAQTTPFGAF